MKKDFYTILNVSKEDSCETIKNKCRPKFMTLHPDKGGKEDEFRQYKEAYEVLTDPIKKDYYDEHKTIMPTDDMLFSVASQIFVQTFKEVMSNDLNENCVFYMCIRKIQDTIFLMAQEIEKLTRILTKIKYKKERMINQNNKQLFIDLVGNEICVIEEHIKAIQNNIENNKKVIKIFESEPNLSPLIINFKN